MNEPDHLGIKMVEAEDALFGDYDEIIATKPHMLQLVMQRRTEALAKWQPKETARLVVEAMEERGIINGKHPSRARKATVRGGITAGAIGVLWMVQDILRAIVAAIR